MNYKNQFFENEDLQMHPFGVLGREKDLTWLVFHIIFTLKTFLGTLFFMGRNILLVEPNFKTKFPPLGLMKISAYHKKLGDKVFFVKGTHTRVSDEYWDRIYVSTLFTYNWNITFRTINHYKKLVKGDISRIIVGGIMASLMNNKIWEATGIPPITGVLSSPGVFDSDNDYIIEDMIPDYELFDEPSQEYTSQKYTLVEDSYFGYLTRGCPHKCDFCGVPRLEPKFIDYNGGLKSYVKKIEELYGPKPYLVFFDNNILFSKKLELIINDIKELGFGKDAKFPFKNKAGQTVYKNRHVDFNQGTDARLMTPENIKLLGEIAIHPLRIAFDSIKFKKQYIRSVKLAADNDIEHLSNYILYNYKDTPEDFWERLKINIDLNVDLGLKIYSFPMKYIPLDATDRSYISEPSWNWQFIRSVQRILNVVRGSVMPGEDFFYRAFGADLEEFFAILHMPEKLLMNRGREPGPDEIDWKEQFKKLTENERKELLSILCKNKTSEKLVSVATKIKNQKLKNILEYYLPVHYNLPLFRDL